MRAPRLRRAASRFREARGGNVAVLSAMLFPVLVLSAVLAVDEGALFNERRAMQNLADLAAMTAAAHPDKAEDAVLMTLLDNGMPTALVKDAGAGPLPTAVEARVRVTGGRYDGAAALAPGARFTAGAKPFNAFKVDIEREGRRYFAQGLMEAPVMRASAIGYAAPEAAFRIGSRLARLDGGVANAVLGALVGGGVSLSVMDYRALADARVDMLDFCDVLAARLRLKAATYGEVLDGSVALPDVLEALGAMRGLDPTAASALRHLARAADRRIAVPLGPLFDPGTAGIWPLGLRRGPVAASASVMEIVDAAVGAARGGRQVEADLGVMVPGVLGASVAIAIGEREQDSPWMRIGERSQAVRTAQTRFLLRLRVGGPGGLLGGVIDLPVYGELAFAEGKLADIACSPGRPAPARVSVNARPGVATLRIGEVAPAAIADFGREPEVQPALLVDARLVKAYGAAQVSISNTAAESLSFSAREIEAATPKTVSTRNLVSSPVASLVENLDVRIQAGPLAVGIPGGLGADLSRTLRLAAEPLDTALFSLLAALGVSLGEADVTVSGGTCNRAALVQ